MGAIITTLNNKRRNILLTNDNTLKFPDLEPGEAQFSDKPEELIKDLLCQIYTVIPNLAFGGTSTVIIVCVIRKLIDFLRSETSSENSMFMTNTERKIIKKFHCLLETDMKSLKSNLKCINDQDLSSASKKTRLLIAEDTCFKLLQNFRNDEFYLKQHPLVFAQFLASFVAIYVPIALASYKVDPTTVAREVCAENMRQLESTVRYFKDEAIKERLSYIHVYSLYKYTWMYDNFVGNGRTQFSVYAIFLGSIPLLLSEEEVVLYRAQIVEKYENYFDKILDVFQDVEL